MEAMQFNMIYVLPTEDGLPPRALLGYVDLEGADYRVPTPQELEMAEMAVFSMDAGCWTLAGTPLPQELSEIISGHASKLGVPGF